MADQIEITCIFCRDGWLDPVLDKWAYKKGEAKVRKKCTTCKGGARIMWPDNRSTRTQEEQDNHDFGQPYMYDDPPRGRHRL